MRCDVLVIGAGPAGSSLAHRLAAMGFDVRLADKKAFPRPKPCGEFLSPQCEPYLTDLGLCDELAALGPRLVRGMHLHGYGSEAIGRFRRLAGQSDYAERGFGIRRERFDAMLVDAAVRAGAQWLPRHEFVSLRRDDNGRIHGAVLRSADGGLVECAAKFVVGADGVHSRVARALGVQRRSRWLDQFALVAHFANVTPLPFAEVHLFPGGFFAATTVDDGLFSVNLVLPRERLAHRDAADWDEFVARHAASAAPAFAARIAGSSRLGAWRGIGPLATSTTAQTFAGAALVGDACGYVDPLTGEGIYFALFTADLLASSLDEALRQPDREPAALQAYSRGRRRELRPRMVASMLLQRALRHPWLVGAFLRQAGRRPALADLVVTLTGDTIHPRNLLHPSFWRQWNATTPAVVP